MNAQAQAFWQEYVDSLNTKPLEPKVYASYAGARSITDELVSLYLAEKKYAGSGLVADYVSAGDPLPAVGDYWIVLDSHDQPRVLVKTARIAIAKYKEVGVGVAIEKW